MEKTRLKIQIGGAYYIYDDFLKRFGRTDVAGYAMLTLDGKAIYAKNENVEELVKNGAILKRMGDKSESYSPYIRTNTMKTIHKTISGYSVITDDTQNAAALADRIEAIGYSVSEIRLNRFTETATLLIVDNAKLGREKLETIL